MTLGRKKLGGSTSHLFSRKSRPTLSSQAPLLKEPRAERHFRKRPNEFRVYPEISRKFEVPAPPAVDDDDASRNGDCSDGGHDSEDETEEGEADLRGWQGELSLFGVQVAGLYFVEPNDEVLYTPADFYGVNKPGVQMI